MFLKESADSALRNSAKYHFLVTRWSWEWGSRQTRSCISCRICLCFWEQLINKQSNLTAIIFPYRSCVVNGNNSIIHISFMVQGGDFGPSPALQKKIGGPFLGGPPLVGPPLEPGFFSVSTSVCRHLTWTHNFFLSSRWNWIKLFGDIPWVFVH